MPFVLARIHPQVQRQIVDIGSSLTMSLRNLRRAGREVGWAEVEHWLWPAFTERWGAWRQSALGLLPACFDAEATSAPPRPLPPPPPLLYALSELVTPRPGFWPASVRMTGILAPPESQVRRPFTNATLHLLKGRSPLVAFNTPAGLGNWAMF